MSVPIPQRAGQPVSSTQNALSAAVRQARQRIRTLMLIRFGSLGLLLSASLAIALVGLGKAHVVAPPAPLALCLLVGISVLVGVACAFWPRLTDVDVAKLTERRADLKERLSSAIEFQQSGVDANAPFVHEQRTDANHFAGGIHIPTLFPVRLPRTFYGGVVLSLLLFGVFFLPSLPVFWSPERKKDIEDVKIAAIAIQKVADDKEKAADIQKLDESKQAAQNIKALTNKMRLGKIEKKPAMVAMTKLTQKLEEQKQKLAAMLPKKSMEEAAKQFKSSLDKMEQDVEKSQQDKQANANKPQTKNGQKPQDKNAQNDPTNKPNEAMKQMQQAMQKMQQAMQMNDTSQMQMAMEKMAQQMQQNGAQMTPQQMQQMAQQMQQLSQALQNTQMQQMSDQMQQLAQQMQQMQGNMTAEQMQQLAQAMKNMAAMMKGQGKGMMTAMLDAKALEELMQALKDGKMTMAMGNGMGNGFGGKGPGSGFGGHGDPKDAMKDPGATKARLLVANKSQWSKAAGKQGDAKKFAEYLAMSSKPSKHAPNGMVMGTRTANGDELQINMTGDPEPTQSSSPYYKAYETSKKQAESTLDKESVPAAYKKQVKDYFDSIHP